METNHLSDPISLTFKHKDTQIHINSNTDASRKIFFLVAYNLDTGHVLAEASPEDRKTELNALGYRVKFYNTPSEAFKIRNIIRKSPFMAPSLLNIY